ncbi:MAG: sporulation protein YqfC [Firmicutes bacterium]|nr:sporulation protein YqfC [Alicyclobacillaceae bacterium]MCL6496938.1 sporulation protein YqfC [Bacillota bacterium]
MRNRRWWYRVAETLEIPPEVLGGVPRVEVVGALQFRVENHRGVVAFDSSRVLVNLPDGRLLVEGRDMVIGWLDPQEIVVTGRVTAVHWVEARRR